MADPPPTRVVADPPMRDWRVTPRHGRSTPIIATGHQPTLWHPGILAKDLAADALARRVGGSALHLVVEHNPLGPITLDLPTRQGDTLGVRRLSLGARPTAATLPPNRTPALDPGRVAQQLDDAAASNNLPPVRDGLRRIAEAYASAGDRDRLSAQTTAVLDALKRPYLSQPTRARPTSALVTQRFVDRLLADPVRCVRCYNRAAHAHPDAGVRPLYLGRDVVEAPLWAQDRGPSVPVFVDLGDSARPFLFTQHQQIGLAGPDALGYLRPRAVTLSAVMRSEHCDLFIHGTGGGVYDRVTERWWQDWIGEPLAPMAVVSADVYLPLSAPQATRDELIHEQWFAHHLPHNVDLYTDASDDTEAALRAEKRRLLDHMNDDRDKRRRSKAFQRIHAINAELCTRHRTKLAEAEARLTQARTGVANAAIARRRDWCFALYPPDSLMALRNGIAQFA
ncbi:MAG: hypothetical protein ACE37H_14330 [Phycisphaeraceae bacterium]